jgi:hypothetical protein
MIGTPLEDSVFVWLKNKLRDLLKGEDAASAAATVACIQ